MRLKSIFLFMLALWTGISTMSADDDGIAFYDTNVDGIYYHLDNFIHEAEVRGSFYSDVVIPSTVTYKGVTYPVTSIASNAFYKHDLKSVTIPNSVTSIGKSAFECCSSLYEITIPDGVTSIGSKAFYDCSNLHSVTIGKGVTSVGDSAFYNCERITSVTFHCYEIDSWFSGYDSIKEVIIGDEVTFIGQSAFASCFGLTSVTIGNSVISVGKTAFSYCLSLPSIIIPESVTSIGDCAFEGCNGMWYISIGNGVTSIGAFAFQGCSGLPSITIPKSVRSIGSDAFAYCSGLVRVNIQDLEAWCKIGFSTDRANPLFYTKKLLLNGVEVKDITIPESVTSIGDYVFYNCEGLTSVTIPEWVTSISNNAFEGCVNISALKWGSNVTSNVITQYCKENLREITLFGAISSIGEKAFYECSGLTSVTIGNSVTSIGEKAFYECSGLTSVTIGNSVTSIGDYAFSKCNGLTSVTIGNSVTSIGDYAFYDCSELTSATIPESVSSIGIHAFQYCRGLTTVTIPNSVTSIGDYTFDGCSGLTSVTIGNGVTSIGAFAFQGCSRLTSITIPESVTSIAENAFEGCRSLTSVTIHCANIGSWFCGFTSINEVIIGDEVTTIGEHAFNGLWHLTSVTIPESVTSIGGYAFRDCTRLTSVTIPESVTTIGENAFNGCKSLTTLTIPNSVTTIGENAFNGCKSLTTLTIPNSVTTIGENAFNGCEGLTSVTIGNGVTSFGNNAFEGCSSLISVTIHCAKIEAWFRGSTSITEVIIGDEVTSIGEEAFYFCRSLTSVTIGNSVTSIGEKAFNECRNLTSVTFHCANIGSWFSGFETIKEVIIGDEVTSIGENAFSGCEGLTSVTIGNSVSSIGKDAFKDCNKYDSSGNGRSVHINELAAWCNINFANAKANPLSFAHHLFINDTEVTNLRIPESVTSLRFGTFYSCYSLRSVTIPNSVTSIGKSSFYGCNGLTSITIPESVTSIGEWAFYSCVGLTSVIIRESVTSIGEKAFSGCASIKFIRSFAHEPPICGSNAFDGINKGECTLFVPIGFVDAYKAADQWKDFLNVKGELVTFPVTGIALNKESATLSVNQTVALEVTVLPETATDKRVTWTSSDESIAAVDGEGVVTGKKVGTATIIATSVSNPDVAASCKVTIVKPVESVTLDVASVVFEEIGETSQLTATVLPEDAYFKTVTWSSSNKKVCTVSAEGLVKAVGRGIATITVTTEDGGKTATCKVTVVIPVTEIALSAETLELFVGEGKKLEVTLSPENATDKSITWTSSDETIAVVDSEGNVEGLKTGTATITALSVSNPDVAASCEVTVLQPVESITLNETSIILGGIGATYQLEATIVPENAYSKLVIWSSSDKERINGVAQVKKATKLNTSSMYAMYGNLGKLDSKAGTPGGFYQDVVPIGADATGFTLFKLENGKNGTYKIHYIYNDVYLKAPTPRGHMATTADPDEAGEFFFAESGNLEGAFKVYAIGLFDKNGTRIKGFNMLQDWSDGMGSNPIASIAEDDTDGKSDWYLYMLDNQSSVCTVSESGLVTAVGLGKATITVFSFDFSKKARCKVTVTEDNGIMPQVGDMHSVSAIYDITGRKLERLQQGINILLLKDGTTRKIRIE